MTIFEICSVVFQAVVTVLGVSGGLWLKHIVDQQVKAKDSTIETLEAVIKSKEAQISHLQADTAPAIAERYTKMRALADQIAADNAKLNEPAFSSHLLFGKQPSFEKSGEVPK